MSPGYTPDIALRSAWPKYPLDDYRYHVANSQVLMIASQLDLATPFHLAAQLASITGKTRKFYSIPLAGHIIAPISFLRYPCPLQLMLSWAFPALFPSEWSNPACIQNMPTAIDFVGATEMGQQASLKLLNVTQPFGNNTYIESKANKALPYISVSSFFLLFYVTRVIKINS